MALDLSSYSAMLKEYYSEQVVENMVYKDNPLLALIKKRTDFGGSNYPIPIITGAAQGATATFADALANQANVDTESFALTRKSKFKIASINNETIDATQSDKGAFLRAMKVQMDGAFRALQLSLATELYGTGTGTLGQISGSVTSGVIQLTNPSDAQRFERNMVLKASQGDGTGTVEAGTGYVIAVDRIGGTVTVSDVAMQGAAGTPTGWSDGDYLYIQGNRNLALSGLDGWLAQPGSSDSWFGVNRSVDPTRLAGVVEDLSSLPIQEAFNQGALLVNREGGSPDYALCSYDTYTALTNAMAGKGQYIDLKGPANITFPSVQLPTPKGMVKVVPDRNCPSNTIYLLTMDSWCLFGLGKIPKYLDNDDLTLLRDPDSNSVQLRIGYYANAYTNAPGWNGKFTVGA